MLVELYTGHPLFQVADKDIEADQKQWAMMQAVLQHPAKESSISESMREESSFFGGSTLHYDTRKIKDFDQKYVPLEKYMERDGKN